MTTGFLPQRISRRYDVSLVSEADDRRSARVEIVDSSDKGKYVATISGNMYKNLRVLMVSGGEAQFDAHIETIKLAVNLKESIKPWD